MWLPSSDGKISFTISQICITTMILIVHLHCFFNLQKNQTHQSFDMWSTFIVQHPIRKKILYFSMMQIRGKLQDAIDTNEVWYLPPTDFVILHFSLISYDDYRNVKEKASSDTTNFDSIICYYLVLTFFFSGQNCWKNMQGKPELSFLEHKLVKLLYHKNFHGFNYGLCYYILMSNFSNAGKRDKRLTKRENC